MVGEAYGSCGKLTRARSRPSAFRYVNSDLRLRRMAPRKSDRSSTRVEQPSMRHAKPRNHRKAEASAERRAFKRAFTSGLIHVQNECTAFDPVLDHPQNFRPDRAIPRIEQPGPFQRSPQIDIPPQEFQGNL